MADKILDTRIQQKSDTSSNWASSNPVLLRGELGFETDTLKFKIGNGTSNYNSLEYFPAVSSITIEGDGGAILLDSSTPITEEGTRKISHATTAGYKHIPAGGSSGQFLGWSSNGTAQWSDLPEFEGVTTDTVQTITASKTFSDGIVVGANSNTTTLEGNYLVVSNGVNSLPGTISGVLSMSGGIVAASATGITSQPEEPYASVLHPEAGVIISTTDLAGDTTELGRTYLAIGGPYNAGASNADVYLSSAGLFLGDESTSFTTTGISHTNASTKYTLNFPFENGTFATQAYVQDYVSDNSYTLPAATSGALGGVRIGYSETGQNYPVELNTSNQMYVNVPWQNTTYTFTGGTNSFRVTPSNGSAQTVNITPSINNATTSTAGLMSADDKKSLNQLNYLILKNSSGSNTDSVLIGDDSLVTGGNNLSWSLFVSTPDGAKTYNNISSSIIVDPGYTSSGSTSNSVIIGENNTASRVFNSVFIGESNTFTSSTLYFKDSLLVGSDMTSSSAYSSLNNSLLVGSEHSWNTNGYQTTANGQVGNSAAIGKGLVLRRTGNNPQVIVGQYNDNGASPDQSTAPSDALFVVGGGSSASSRADVFWITPTKGYYTGNDFTMYSSLTVDGSLDSTDEIRMMGDLVVTEGSLPKYYTHNIFIVKTTTPYIRVRARIINKSSTAFTASSLGSYLSTYHNSDNYALMATGAASTSNTSSYTLANIVKGIYYIAANNTFYFDVMGTSYSSSADILVTGSAWNSIKVYDEVVPIV